VVQNEQKNVFICNMDRFDMAQYVKDRATLKNALVANMLFWSHFNSFFLQTKHTSYWTVPFNFRTVSSASVRTSRNHSQI